MKIIALVTTLFFGVTSTTAFRSLESSAARVSTPTESDATDGSAVPRRCRLSRRRRDAEIRTWRQKSSLRLVNAIIIVRAAEFSILGRNDIINSVKNIYNFIHVKVKGDQNRFPSRS